MQGLGPAPVVQTGLRQGRLVADRGRLGRIQSHDPSHDTAHRTPTVSLLLVTVQMEAAFCLLNKKRKDITALEQKVPQLGAVLSYGALVAPMQRAFEAEVAAQPHRLLMRFGTPVRGLKPVPGGVEVDADIADVFDLAVVAEGGVFADQPALTWPQGLSRDYEQTAWVGQVRLDDGPEGVACERFTPSGPAALLPLPPAWCWPRSSLPVMPSSARSAGSNSAARPDR